MNPKKSVLTESPVPIRIDPATRENLDAIKARGLAKDDSAAFRAAAAALHHGLVVPLSVVEELMEATDELITAVDPALNMSDEVILKAVGRARNAVARIRGLRQAAGWPATGERGK